MDKLGNGDQVACKIKDFYVVSAYASDYDSIEIFEVIGRKDNVYYVYVPVDMILRETVIIDEYNYKQFSIDKKFIDSTAFLLTEYQVFKLHKKNNGLKCEKCQEFFEYATANQSDGTLICWSCKNYPIWKGKIRN
jgi:hypothetical protein